MGVFDELKSTIDKSTAKAYFEKLEGATIPPFKIEYKSAQPASKIDNNRRLRNLKKLKRMNKDFE